MFPEGGHVDKYLIGTYAALDSQAFNNVYLIQKSGGKRFEDRFTK